MQQPADLMEYKLIHTHVSEGNFKKKKTLGHQTDGMEIFIFLRKINCYNERKYISPFKMA